MLKPVARKSDMHVCPLHGIGAIAEGYPTANVEGQSTARVGDAVVCQDGFNSCYFGK